MVPMKSELKSSSYPTMELLLIILMKNCFKHPISLLTNCFIFCLAEYVLFFELFESLCHEKTNSESSLS